MARHFGRHAQARTFGHRPSVRAPAWPGRHAFGAWPAASGTYGSSGLTGPPWPRSAATP